jgi:hypothetical protein
MNASLMVFREKVKYYDNDGQIVTLSGYSGEGLELHFEECEFPSRSSIQVKPIQKYAISVHIIGRCIIDSVYEIPVKR